MTLFRPLCPPPARNARLILRIAGWNLLFILVGLLLIGIAGEVYFRLTVPFTDSHYASWRFVPGVGILYEPNAEVRFTNNLDFWTVQRANSLGFLDREPIGPLRAAESCHITIIGDSLVDAREVDISDKLQVRLEETVSRYAPHLDVTASAFGFSGTAQVPQLAFYDGYARHLSPDLVVLVFAKNDLRGNLAVLEALRSGYDPGHMSYVHAYRESDGSMAMRLPDPDFWEHRLPSYSETGRASTIVRLPWVSSVLSRLSGISYFARYLYAKNGRLGRIRGVVPGLVARVRHLMEQPEYVHLFEEQETAESVSVKFAQIDSGIESAITREAWDAMEFGLEQFKRRADHDGAALMILTLYDSGGEGDHVFARLSSVAASLDIPVVSQYKYIVDHGGRVEDARWDHDGHLNPKGHRWAAEAVWEHIESEWSGKCPSGVSRSDVEVDRISVGRYFHAPEGVAFAESFPALNLEGYASVYRSVVSGLPVARSEWDVHLYDGGLTYVKEPCVAEDVERRFFLHVFPDDQTVLMSDRRARGFDDLSFDFYDRGERFDGRCMVSTDLPRYDIASIRTGQFVRDVGSDVEVWSVRYNFALPEMLDAVNELRQSGHEPVIRSVFDVYIDDGRLVYLKDSCDSADRDTPFFLHVFPSDENGLPDRREDSGFENLDFELMQKGGELDGYCFAAVDLPEYKISSISTGQVVGGVETWRAYHNFNFSEIMYAVQEIRRSGREPDIRSNFDVYIDDGRLVYVKDSCDADDRDLPFFLHVFPSDENDLPDRHEDSGFDNLDFELMQRGGELDGYCFAVVDLPAYDITGIGTGQWVRGEGNVWEASIEFGE